MTKAASGYLRFALAAGVSLAALGSAPAFAQDTTQTTAPQADAEAPADPNEIIVTAQFREQKLQDIPIAITAVDAATIEARSATSLAQVTNAAPSVVLRPASAAFGNAIFAFIRGLGQGDFSPALEPGVGLYIDDVYYPRLTGANFDLMDVERIEVLRGPQGTLTGKNSEGGAIKFISRKPKGDNSGYVSATYGTRNRINLRASADFKLTDDLFGRLSGTFADQDGYVKVLDYGCANPGKGIAPRSGGTKCTQYKGGDVGYKALRGILRYNPSDTLDVMISGDYNKDSRNNAADILLYANSTNPNTRTVEGIPYDSRFVCGRFCNYGSTIQEGGAFIAGLIPPLNGFPLAETRGQQKTDYKGWGVSGNIDIGLSDTIKLQSISAYREWDTQFTIDGDLSPARGQIGNNDLTHWFWSQELRLNADLTDWIQTTLGGYISDEKTTYYTLQDIRYVSLGLPAGVCAAIGGLPTETCPLFPLQFIGNDPVRTKSKAVFGTAIIKPVDALTITLGARYTHDSKDYTFFRFNVDGKTINAFLDPVGAANGAGYNGPNGVALTGRTAPFRGNRFDYRASVDYRFSPEVLAYATVSTGYKAGGVGPRPFNAAQARGFGPEKLTTYELGLKTDLFDRKARINLTTYYNDFKDAQLTLLSCPQFGGPGPCALPQNAGNAKQYGFEAEAFLRPVEGLTIDASASYIHFKYKCVNPAVVGLAGTGCSSAPAVTSLLAPPANGWQWNVGAQYEIGLGGSGKLVPRIDVNHQKRLLGNVLASAVGSPSDLFGQVPGYTLANARLSWKNADDDLDISLEVTNLFDKYYFSSKFDLSGLAGAIEGSPGRPREWAVTIKKKF